MSATGMNTGKMLRLFGAAAVLSAGVAGATNTAQAGVTSIDFASGGSIENTGVSFSGSMSYDDVANLLTVNLTNTSTFQSVITSFYFNIAGDATATYNPIDNTSTAGVNESSFALSNSLSPFGSFDGGAILTNLSKQQVRGIDEGETGIFTFNISGADAKSLAALSFFTDANSGGGLSGAFAAKFQSIGDNAELSDKLFGVLIGGRDPKGPPPTPIPLPPAAWAALVTMGLTGLGSLRRRFQHA